MAEMVLYGYKYCLNYIKNTYTIKVFQKLHQEYKPDDPTVLYITLCLFLVKDV